MILIAAMIPWKKHGDDPVNNTQIDSLMNVTEQLSQKLAEEEYKLRWYTDSINDLNETIKSKNANYLTLKKENEKLLKERSAFIRRFSNDDILRYLSNRYGQDSIRP